MAAVEASGARAGASLRRDGRNASQMRPMSCELSLLHRADGSARLASGGSSVLVGVYGPTQPKVRRLARSDRATLSVTVNAATGTPGPVEKELQETLKAALETVVLLTQYPRLVINVIVQVLSDDGASTALAINAASLALVDAAVSMKGFLTAAAVGIRTDGTVFMDPLLAEEVDCAARATCAFSNVSPTKPVTLDVSGMCDDTGLEQLRLSGEAACGSARAFLELVMRRKVHRDAGEPLPSVVEATKILVEAKDAAGAADS